MKERNINIDAIKGYAIILVVLGHSLQNEYGIDNILFRFIYSYHMPLFMMISGYCAFNSNRENDFLWLKRRFASLFVPFAIWIILKICVEYRFDVNESATLIKNVLLSPDRGGYWFLFTLFQLCILLFICNCIISFVKIKKYDFLIYFIVVVFLNILHWKFYVQIFGMYLLSWHSFFYFSGYLMKKYQIIQKLRPYLGNKIIWSICIIGSILILPLYKITGAPVYIEYFNSVLSIGFIQKLFWIFMRYFVPLLGIFFSYILIKLFPEKVNQKLAFLGRYTIEIYILSGFLFIDIVSNQIVNVILQTIVSLMISLIIAIATEKGYLGKILFGK